MKATNPSGWTRMVKSGLFGLWSVMLILSPVSAQIAVKGEKIYPVAAAKIDKGVVLIKNGKIEAIGPEADVAIPEGYKIVSAKVVTPGLIDAHATVGFTGIYNQKHDQEQLDKSNPIQPELRAIDAYNPGDALVEYLRSFGITTVHTGHGPGALISGQTLVAKTRGLTIADVTLDDATMLALTLDNTVRNNFKSPGSLAKGTALLRTELIKAQEYLKKQSEASEKRPPRDLKLETLGLLLDGKLTALVTANRVHTMMNAIRLSEEFGFKLVLDGAAEAYLLIDEIKASGAGLILHPPMARKSGNLKNASFETPAIIHQAGIPFALQSGFESYVPKTRVILFEAAIAARYGLPFEAALASITLNAARIIGVADRTGSLETGKDADLVLFDGDPFEYTTHVCTVIIDGEIVAENCDGK